MTCLTQWQFKQLIFLNKSAVNEHTADKRYSWSSHDYLCRVRTFCKRSKRWNILSALSMNRYIAVNIFQNFYIIKRFNKFIQLQILFVCQSEHILVMNNTSIHCSEYLKWICYTEKMKIIFLSLYSSNFNSIKKFFHALKAWIKRHQIEAQQYENDFKEFLWLTVKNFMRELNIHEFYRSSCIE